jgi:hypothetical protein
MVHIVNLPNISLYPAFFGSGLFLAGGDTLFVTGGGGNYNTLSFCLNQDKFSQGSSFNYRELGKFASIQGWLLANNFVDNIPSQFHYSSDINASLIFSSTEVYQLATDLIVKNFGQGSSEVLNCPHFRLINASILNTGVPTDQLDLVKHSIKQIFKQYYEAT